LGSAPNRVFNHGWTRIHQPTDDNSRLITGVQTPWLVDWERGGIGFVLVHLAESGPIQIPAADEDSGDLGGVVDVFQRVCIKKDEVRDFPDLHRAHLLFPAKITDRVDRRGLQGLPRSQSALRQQRQFIMDAKAGECVGIWSIGPGQNFDSRPSHHPHQFTLLREAQAADPPSPGLPRTGK